MYLHRDSNPGPWNTVPYRSVIWNHLQRNACYRFLTYRDPDPDRTRIRTNGILASSGKPDKQRKPPAHVCKITSQHKNYIKLTEISLIIDQTSVIYQKTTYAATYKDKTK